MPFIEVRDLSLARGGQTVLHHVNLTVEPGEILVLVGPSGSGKSSLLRCLNRLEEPAPGTVLMRGEDITTLDVTVLRRRVGMVFQQTIMFAGTVADNLAYGPRAAGSDMAPPRVSELLEQVMLTPALAEKSALELSGGQAQRVAIARALANEPEVLLLDEPTSALDPIATRAVEGTLRHLRDSLGLTLIWISHVVDQARRMADRVLLLDGGRVVRVDTVEAMLDPQNGDFRALAFANGDAEAMQAERHAAAEEG